MNRYEFLYKKYVDGDEIPSSYFEKMVNCDPTTIVVNGVVKRVGKYVQWILNMYVKRRFDCYVADLQYMEENLFKFERIKHLLKPEQRDIMKLKNIEVLGKLVEKYWEEKFLFSKEEWKKKVKRKFVKYVYEDEFFDVVIPLSEEASYELAGPPISRWCTAVKADSYFDRYAIEGPMYMIRDKSQIITCGKGSGEPRPLYQLHFPSGHFCDRDDNEFDLARFLNKHQKLKEFFKSQFIAAMHNAAFSDRVLINACMDLYGDAFFMHRLRKIFKQWFRTQLEIKLTDHGFITPLFEYFGYDKMLNYIFEHINENVKLIQIKFKNYTGEGYCIPDSIGNLKKLTSLEFEGFVKKIPESIGKLENLSLLLLGKNKVKSIPETVKNCKRLEIIDLRNSDIDITTLKTQKNVYVKYGKDN